MQSRLAQWFFTTKLGELYFEVLLWLDRKKDNPDKYLTPKEIAQITRHYSLLDKGIKEVKTKVNIIVNSHTAEEYDKVLKEIEDLFQFSKYDDTSSEHKIAQLMRAIKVKKGNKDIITHTEKAKMIQDRIGDYKQLQDHKLKRETLRDIRKAKKSGDAVLAEKLEQEWKVKYGNRR